MEKLALHTNPEVESIFAKYPDSVRDKMFALRSLVIETARETDGITALEETLKWGEPSYLTKKGSTIRMDWKQKTPERYALYFKCTSRLVETFRSVFGNKFLYEGNRAIIFKLGDQLPEAELKHCIKAALRYHQVKQLPALGI